MSDSVPVKQLAIAQTRAKMPPAAIAGIFAALGLTVFLALSSARMAGEEQSGLPSLAAMTATDVAPEVPGATAKPTQAAPAATGPFSPGTFSPTRPFVTAPAQSTGGLSGYSGSVQPTPAVTPPAIDPLQGRSNAPAMVIDLAQAVDSGSTVAAQPRGDEQPAEGRAPGVSVAAGQSATPSSVGGSASDQGLTADERFAGRVENEGADAATAKQMVNLDRMVPQGTIIAAVMETALNSDLPGYARAIISRDVRSFDGSTVLVPAGSRVIGQYKSGVALGASRVFVVWTRLIRPDGVTISLGSPATDDLGRAGIGGKVNRHFLQRFGGAILTSVLTGGINAAAASVSRGSTVVVSSASEASNLASQAGRSADIPPTITTKQGARVRIFVARDLDFSKVGAVR